MKADGPGDSLKYQWRIMGAVLRSGWATGLDKSIAFEIVDNYRKDFRNSRASLSYLMSATGAGRKSVIASTRRLVENGPFRVIRQGAGTRPTEYGIDFDSVRDLPSGGADATTNKLGSSSGVEPTSTSGAEPTTSGFSSGVEPTESVLHVAAYEADLHDRKNDCAPAAPPPAVGLVATAAEGAQGGFGELFKTYYATTKGHAGSKAKARDAYEKMNVTPAAHADLVASARAWHDAWAAQGKPDAPRMHLATWLAREEFENNPPSAYQPKERKAKAGKSRAAVANDNGQTMRIISTDGIGNPFSDWGLRVVMDDEAGTVHEFVIENILTAGSNGPDAELYRALGDADGLNPGARVKITAKGDRLIDVKPHACGNRVVQINDADSDDGVNVFANMVDPHGRPEGQLELDKHRLKALCDVLGIIKIQDTDELLGRRFVIDEHGEFRAASNHERRTEYG